MENPNLFDKIFTQKSIKTIDVKTEIKPLHVSFVGREGESKSTGR
jgi:hypothetical protein